jgi:hypothetical protein
MTLSFARSSGSIYTLCSVLAKSRCGGVLVVDIHHVYHQHFMHFHISCVPFDVNLLYTNEFHKFWWICERRSTQEKIEGKWPRWQAVRPQLCLSASNLGHLPRHWSRSKETQPQLILAVSSTSIWSKDPERPHFGLKGPHACSLQHFSPGILHNRHPRVIKTTHEKVGDKWQHLMADRPFCCRSASNCLHSNKRTCNRHKEKIRTVHEKDGAKWHRSRAERP